MRPLFLLATAALAGLTLMLSAVGPFTPASAAQIAPFGPPLDGRVLFVKGGDMWLWRGYAARQLTQGETWRQPQWSPDGGKIAYVYQSQYFTDIYTMAAIGGNYARLTRSQSSFLEENDWAFHPAWSPDGRQIAYTSDTSSFNPTLWLMNADGANKRQVFAPSGGFFGAVDGISWSPDGTRIAAASFAGGIWPVSQIYVLDLASRAQRVLTQVAEGAIDPAWSPAGRWIAFAARVGGRVTLHVMREDGTGARQIADQSPARRPTWSPDGRKLAFVSAQTGTFEMYVMDTATDGDGLRFSSPRQVTRDLGVDALSGLSWGR